MNIIRKLLGFQDLKFDDELQRKVVSFPSSDWKVGYPKKPRFGYEYEFTHKTSPIKVTCYIDGNPMGYSVGGDIRVKGKVISTYHDELYHSHPVGKHFNDLATESRNNSIEEVRKNASRIAKEI